jgi:hypothetical protein
LTNNIADDIGGVFNTQWKNVNELNILEGNLKGRELGRPISGLEYCKIDLFQIGLEGLDFNSPQHSSQRWAVVNMVMNCRFCRWLGIS